jgi:ADP-ribosylglycohydrolase
MTIPISHYKEQIYAGVLGKIIGVYLGRPVEGWAYEAIRERFGEISYYINESTGAPLVAPDDDISGTFVFVRALEDNAYSPELSSRQIGETWLNYIIENKTILWWGGLGRSTEHTAYLRLKAGIAAPHSGSMALNGQTVAEQIGAQIFVDGWALCNPGDPQRAAALARQAARVSHDGLAVEAACFLAAMEALAFEETGLVRLAQEGLKFVHDDRLLRLVDEVITQCQATSDWRTVRDWIARHHGYERYGGTCPMATNHAALLMALLMGGDDFQRSISIATSAGWDTDCNAGNVGCLNGIRLGLAGIQGGADFRGPVADRMYVVSAAGGECLSDAVLETRKLVAAAGALRGELVEQPARRFAFELPGSTQGFAPHPACTPKQALVSVRNALEPRGETGLLIEYEGLESGRAGCVSVRTFIDPEPVGEVAPGSYALVASPTLYPTQTLQALVKTYSPHNPRLAFFIEHCDAQGEIATLTGESCALDQGFNRLAWQVPDVGGGPIHRLGLQLASETRLDGALNLVSLDWDDAPQYFSLGSAIQLSAAGQPWTPSPAWLRAFVSSAQIFEAEPTGDLLISHPAENGIVTIGTAGWRDYGVESRITFLLHKAAGLVLRSRGHRRYYAAVLSREGAVILKSKDGARLPLAVAPFPYRLDETHTLVFSAQGERLALWIDGAPVAEARDADYRSGAAGFVVDEGAILCDGFTVRNLPAG